MKNTVDLNGVWTLRALDADRRLPAAHRRVLRWMPASVPGTVHTDLLAAGLIPDPSTGMAESDVQWVENQQWVYRRTFSVPGQLLKERSVELVAEGLDTYAEIRCNGKTIGKTENMFVEHRLPIKHVLKPGKNTLEIIFDSPVDRSRALEQRHGALHVALESHRVYARKAQYSFGWDWGPKLTTSGIWRGIRLEAWSGARLDNPVVRTESIAARDAMLEITTSLVRADRSPYSPPALRRRSWLAGGTGSHCPWFLHNPARPRSIPASLVA